MARDGSVEVRVDSLAFGGAGVARLPSGKVVFVDRAAPGDLVRIKVRKERRSHVEAEVDVVLEAGPERVEPACAVADRCGGCPWGHLPVEVQRRWKQKLLGGELARAGLVADASAVAVPLGGQALGHRTRARLHRRGELVGTMARRSHRVIPFGGCPILAPDLEAFASEAAEALGAYAPADADLELYVDAAGRRGLALEPIGEAPRGLWQGLAVELGLAALCIGGPGRRASGQGSGRDLLQEQSLDRLLAFEPGVFVQANREMNAALVEQVLSHAGQGDRFAEVYAGAGNFTVHLAGRFGRGSASESGANAAHMLRLNLESVGPSVSVHCERDHATARRLAAQSPADLVVADPPRSGMRALRPLFDRSPPARVVMVSCHPMAAVRDLRALVGAGYVLEEVVPIDLFPETDHLELVARLRR